MIQCRLLTFASVMILRLLICLVAFASASVAQTKKPAAAGPEEAARSFYTELLARKVTGLPQGEDWAALAPRMTEPLAAAIRSAQKEQAEFMKKEPNEKPPWIEGDLFSSLFEGAQKFTLGKARITGSTAEIPVSFTYTYQGDTSRWTDTLLLQETAKGWQVDDVAYGGGWDFSNRGTLKDALSPEPQAVSPDGRFEFVPFSVEENNAGKPPFGIIEKATGKLIWSAPGDFGDASRPEEWVLWSPDSKRFALVTRVSTRRLGAFFFGLDGQTFVPMPWKDAGRLEALADAQIRAAAKKEGYTKKASYGQIISDDTLPVRWTGTDSIIVTRTMSQSVGEAGKEGISPTVTARVLLGWDAKARAFSVK